MNLEYIGEDVLSWVTTNGIRLIIGIIASVIVWKIINKVVENTLKILRHRGFDETVARFLETAALLGLRIVLIITLLGYLGVNLAGLAALLASAGLAIGLALQGSLSNLAGGVIILVLRPFKVGDYIETSNNQGTVLKIQIFYTHLLTTDNREVLIPNGKLANESVVNQSSQATRRVDLVFGISYDDDLLKAKAVLYDIVENCPLIIQDQKPFVGVNEQAASSINLIVKAWCENAEYANVKYYLLEEVKLRFDKEGISLPFNQLDVNLKK